MFQVRQKHLQTIAVTSRAVDRGPLFAHLNPSTSSVYGRTCGQFLVRNLTKRRSHICSTDMVLLVQKEVYAKWSLCEVNIFLWVIHVQKSWGLTSMAAETGEAHDNGLSALTYGRSPVAYAVTSPMACIIMLVWWVWDCSLSAAWMPKVISQWKTFGPAYLPALNTHFWN